jgi:hypothetical protein
MKTALHNFKNSILAACTLFCAMQVQAQVGTTTEFVFKNAVLVSGVANQDGAVYLFRDVADNVDATVTVVGRSGPEVILDTIDIAPGGGMGFEKALQPQVGLHGTAPAYAKWWMKFKVNFFEAGTGNPVKIEKFSASAVDVDGDNVSITENITVEKTMSTTTSVYSVLTGPVDMPVECSKEGLHSLAIICPDCLGLGYRINGAGKHKDCNTCDNTGKVFALCGHAWSGSDIYKQGTVVNALGIDTLAINNMATFTYVNTDEINFTYGATTGGATSSAAMRLNSMWFKTFDYGISALLPVKLIGFAAAMKSGAVQLNWATATEQSFNGFIIQRSADGKTFTDCGTVLSMGKEFAQTSYSYADKNFNPSAAIAYYRLKMVETSGRSTFSPVQTVRLQATKSGNATVSAFPNPAKENVLVNIPSGWQGKKVTTDVYNAAGVKVQQVQFNNANTTEQLETARLSPGLYILSISCEGTTMQTKLLKS